MGRDPSPVVSGPHRPTAPGASTSDDADREPRERWSLLLKAVIGMASDVSLDDLLTRIVEAAATLGHARYAALGVIGEHEDRRLRRFITHGTSDEDAERIGRLPEGHGILGLLVDHPEALRLGDLTAHADALGFPPGHPAMTSFLGVPVRIHGKVFGNLYLTEKLDGSTFSEQDEEIVSALAAAAGVAIENTRLHEEAVRREHWLSAATEVTTLLMRPGNEGNALQLLADRSRELASADVAWVVAGPDDSHLSVRVVSGMSADPQRMAELDLNKSLARRVMQSGLARVVDDLSSDPEAVNVADLLGWEPLGPAVLVPLRTWTDVHGVIALGWHRGTDPAVAAADTTLPTLFAEQAALALHITRSRRDERRLALLEDRDRIARDLHDLVIQRLFAVGLGLQGLARLSDPAAVKERVDRAIEDLDTTIHDIRRTIFALGTMDTAGDLRAAVAGVVERAARMMGFHPEVLIRGPLESRVDEELGAELLAVLTEALSNVARHAQASRCEVELSAAHGVLLSVTDDGCGLPGQVNESGLANMRRRAERRGGHLTITSGTGEGTIVVWWVPGS